MDARDIIIRPIVTEKSMQLFNRDNKYTFRVAKDANKIQIREAIEEIFKVRVLRVTTMIVKGKTVRRGRYVGKKSDWKKAIVQVHQEDKIEINGAALLES